MAKKAGMIVVRKKQGAPAGCPLFGVVWRSRCQGRHQRLPPRYCYGWLTNHEFAHDVDVVAHDADKVGTLGKSLHSHLFGAVGRAGELVGGYSASVHVNHCYAHQSVGAADADGGLRACGVGVDGAGHIAFNIGYAYIRQGSERDSGP